MRRGPVREESDGAPSRAMPAGQRLRALFVAGFVLAAALEAGFAADFVADLPAAFDEDRADEAFFAAVFFAGAFAAVAAAFFVDFAAVFEDVLVTARAVPVVLAALPVARVADLAAVFVAVALDVVFAADFVAVFAAGLRADFAADFAAGFAAPLVVFAAFVAVVFLDGVAVAVSPFAAEGLAAGFAVGFRGRSVSAPVVTGGVTDETLAVAGATRGGGAGRGSLRAASSAWRMSCSPSSADICPRRTMYCTRSRALSTAKPASPAAALITSRNAPPIRLPASSEISCARAVSSATVSRMSGLRPERRAGGAAAAVVSFESEAVWASFVISGMQSGSRV